MLVVLSGEHDLAFFKLGGEDDHRHGLSLSARSVRRHRCRPDVD
jgi:hypothetical protein